MKQYLLVLVMGLALASKAFSYEYVSNNPVNAVDPLGLFLEHSGVNVVDGPNGLDTSLKPPQQLMQEGRDGMVAAAAGAATLGAALAAPELGAAAQKNLHLDGPQRGGRICQIRWGNAPLVRLDNHPIPGSGGKPVVHLNIGPGQGKKSIHIPLWPLW